MPHLKGNYSQEKDSGWSKNILEVNILGNKHYSNEPGQLNQLKILNDLIFHINHLKF